MGFIVVDEQRCACEGACIESCPYGLLRRGESGLPEGLPGGERACIRCGHCVAVCPTGALANALLDRHAFTDAASLDRAADPLGGVMRLRRSVRSFRPEALPRGDIEALLDVARHAPTANNAQALWWIATSGPEATGRLATLARQWMHKTFRPDSVQDPWPADSDPVLRGAPHVLVCCGPAQSRWGAVDAAIALAHLDLLAASRGLGCLWAGVFTLAAEACEPLAEELALPEGQKAYGALALGRPRHSYRLIPPRKPAALHWR